MLIQTLTGFSVKPRHDDRQLITREEKKKDREIESLEKKEIVFIHRLSIPEFELQLNREANSRRKRETKRLSLPLPNQLTNWAPL